jgi:hypothetical protein
MATTRKLFGLLVLCVAAAWAAGCSGSHGGRVAVSGTVKLKGQSIKDGAIVLFEPLENQDTAGNATVTGGAFAIPREAGLKPGKYLIRITAGDGKTAVNPVDPDSPPGPGGTNIISKDAVPRDWNVNSKQEVTVTKDGPNRFDFNIP